MSFIQDKEKPAPMTTDIRSRIRAYIVENLLLGADVDLADAPSLLEAGVLDSTGAMELVGFIEQEFMVTVSDSDIVPENLDSIDGITGFVMRKIEDRQDVVQ